MDLIKLLEMLSVLNRDNGKRFRDPGRLDVIASLLWNGSYRRINADGLFHLYAKKPVEAYRGGEAIVVSSHVDCEESITRCFSRSLSGGLLKGTYDNAITNAAVLSLMLSDSLPEWVLIAFTGDEEEETHGAEQLAQFLRKNEVSVRHLFVLDVTDMGWDHLQVFSADFTIENNHWQDDFGEKLVRLASNRSDSWKFVPRHLSAIPSWIPRDHLIRHEAEEDESWYYGSIALPCCSVCLPVCGEMHSDEGVLAWESSFREYTAALGEMLCLSPA